VAFSTSTSSKSDDHLHLGDAGGQAHVNALLYRARQRGFLELDLLLGGWATRNASKLDARGRAALEELLGLENPDLFAWLTGQVPVPHEVASNVAFQSIAADVAERLHKHRPLEAKSKDGAKWVRGWDDIKKEGGKKEG
jgi:succinate dehydrogenase flavin-adding protein (antitoxin of CptAB toxin-antitoxin module)